MSACFSWLLDARLHLTLIASMVASAIGGDRPAIISDSDTRYDRARVVAYIDGSPMDHSVRFTAAQSAPGAPTDSGTRGEIDRDPRDSLFIHPASAGIR